MKNKSFYTDIGRIDLRVEGKKGEEKFYMTYEDKPTVENGIKERMEIDKDNYKFLKKLLNI